MHQAIKDEQLSPFYYSSCWNIIISADKSNINELRIFYINNHIILLLTIISTFTFLSEFQTSRVCNLTSKSGVPAYVI